MNFELSGNKTLLVQPSISTPGVPREKLYLMMQAADYFALYKGGNPELVQDGVNGLLVPYIDVAALAATIVHAFETGKRAKLSANSQLGMERFAFERMVDETDRVLRFYLPKSY